MKELCLAAALLLPAAAAAEAPPAPPELDAMLARARDVQVADTAAWKRFQFKREIRRQDRDASGQATASENLLFRVTPSSEGFDEELLGVDGRKPTAEEVEYYRRSARFSKHYRTLLGGGEAGGESGYTLGMVFRMSAYRYAGRETVDGIPCHRIDFEPDLAKEGRGLEGKFARAMAGSLWLTVDGLHLLQAEAKSRRPVSIALSLAKFHAMSLKMRSGAVAADIWLPRRIEVETYGRILVRTRRRLDVYLYSDFLPVAETKRS